MSKGYIDLPIFGSVSNSSITQSNQSTSIGINNYSLRVDTNVSGQLTFNLLDGAGNIPSSSSPVLINFFDGGSSLCSWLPCSVNSATTYTTPTGGGTGTLGLDVNDNTGVYNSGNFWIYIYAVYRTATSIDLAISTVRLDEAVSQTIVSSGVNTNYNIFGNNSLLSARIRLIGRADVRVTPGNGQYAVTAVNCLPFDTGPAIGCVALNAFQSIVSGGNTLVQFDTKTSDTMDAFSTTNFPYSAFIVTKSGYHTVSAALSFAVNAGQTNSVQLFLNGSLFKVLGEGSGGNVSMQGGTITDYFSQTSNLTIIAYQDSGLNVNVGGDITRNYFSVAEVPFRY